MTRTRTDLGQWWRERSDTEEGKDPGKRDEGNFESWWGRERSGSGPLSPGKELYSIKSGSNRRCRTSDLVWGSERLVRRRGPEEGVWVVVGEGYLSEGSTRVPDSSLRRGKYGSEDGSLTFSSRVKSWCTPIFEISPLLVCPFYRFPVLLWKPLTTYTSHRINTTVKCCHRYSVLDRLTCVTHTRYTWYS